MAVTYYAPLTEQMSEYLAALYHLGTVKGRRFGMRYDATRRALLARGLVSRETSGDRAIFSLTPLGIEHARTLPNPEPEASQRCAPALHARLAEVKAGRW